MVQWFNVKAKTGIASLYSSSINLNTTAMYPFEDAYRVQVGLDDDGNIVIQPNKWWNLETQMKVVY